MRWSRAVRLSVCGGLTLSALGCAQIAGLTDDYHLANAGAAGSAGASGGVGMSGESGASDDAGAGGAPSANGGSLGSTGGAVNANGGASGASAGRAGTSGGAGAGGTSGAGGAGTSGGGGTSGGAGTAGSAGASGFTGGPVRIGFSEFHDSASGSDNASAHLADASFAKPSGTSGGDLILVFFGADHSLSNLSSAALLQSGWTLIDQHEDYGQDGQATYLLYKFADANEDDPVVFHNINSASDGGGVQGLLSVYRGVSATKPVNAYQWSLVTTGKVGTAVTTATPAITTTVANCLVIAGLSPDTAIDAPVINSWPDGFVEDQLSVNNPTNPYPYGWANIYSAERHLAAAGTVPASAFAWTVVNGGQYYGSLSFVLALAPSR